MATASNAPPESVASISRVALVGNPNTGKSTLFNALAGMSVRTGNYPGVTIEKKIGRCTVGDRTIDTHMLNLRQKLERDHKQPLHLVTVHGVGYRLLEQPEA